MRNYTEKNRRGLMQCSCRELGEGLLVTYVHDCPPPLNILPTKKLKSLNNDI